MPRPWPVRGDIWFGTKETFHLWLKERGGIVVYENHMMDSSHLGETTYMPARYLAEEDNQLHDAPEEYRPNGGLPSLRQQRVDHIRLEEFGGDEDRLLRECFKYKEVVMTVKDLIDELQKIADPMADVILSKDGEGNGFSPLSGISKDHYFPDEKRPWSVELNKKGNRKCIVFWPTN
jgi:hypothetical protein